MRTEITRTKSKISSLIEATEPLDGGEILEEIPAIRGELKKPSSSDRLNKESARLEKVMNKTDKLLEKAKSQSSHNSINSKSSHSHNNIITKSYQSHNALSSGAPTILDYQMLNRLPKKLMSFIFDEHKEQGIVDDDLFVIDTEKAKEKINKSPNQIANTIMRLKEKRYITVEKSNNCGTRAIKINKSLFE